MKNLLTFWITFSLLLGIANASEAIAADRAVAFKNIEGKKPLKLHIYQPNKGALVGSCVVFFFGGGWTGGTPAQFYQQAHALSQQGVLAICAEYRTKKSHGVSPDICVEDAKSAIRWVRKHASELAIDPTKIIAAGGSAGGHLAACTSLVDGFDLATEDLSISSKPNALVLFNPVLDTTKMGYGVEKMKEFGTKLSPCHLVKPGLPPTLVLHGEADQTVPFENAQRFVELMQKAGNQCTLKSYSGAGHGFFNSAWFRKKSNKEHYQSTLNEMESFLTPMGYISPKK